MISRPVLRVLFVLIYFYSFVGYLLWADIKDATSATICGMVSFFFAGSSSFCKGSSSMNNGRPEEDLVSVYP